LASPAPAKADQPKVAPDLVRFTPQIEPVVRLIEETPREKCSRLMLEQLRKGLPYRNFLAALYLANIRTGIVNPPLAVLHSANELAWDLPLSERLVTMLWALDRLEIPLPVHTAEF